MGRLAAFVLTLCVGCAGNETYLTDDGIWGSMASRFSSAPRYAPPSTTSSPAFYPDMVVGKSPDAPTTATAALGGK